VSGDDEIVVTRVHDEIDDGQRWQAEPQVGPARPAIE
jgi:hypothetical protein